MSWLAIFPRGELAGLAALRTDPGLEVAVVGSETIVRFKSAELLSSFDRCACQVYRKEESGLILEGDRVATRALLPGEQTWWPIADWWTIELGETVRAQRALPVVPLRLVRCAASQAPSAMLCSLRDLKAWSERAAAIRLSSLEVAVSDSGEAWVVGSILPSVSGRRFWHYGEDVFVPLGQALDPPLGPRQVRQSTRAAQGCLVVAEDGWQTIPRECLVPLTRPTLRASLHEGEEVGR